MTKRALWAVADTVASGTDAEPFVTFVTAARLFAWAKLTSEGALPAALGIESPEVEGRDIEDVFAQLEQATEMGGAFGSLNLSPPRRLNLALRSADSARRAASTATKQAVANYKDIADCLPGIVCSRGDLGLAQGMVDAMVSLVDPDVQTIYCPFGRSTPLGLAAARRFPGKVFAELKAGGLESLYALHNVLDPAAAIKVQLRDAIREPGFVKDGALIRFDSVLAAPPLGMRYDESIADLFGRFPGRALYGDVLHLSHLMAQAKSQVIALVAHAFLFRASGGEASFKQQLLGRGAIEAVLSLPQLAIRGRPPESVIVLNPTTPQVAVWFADFGIAGSATGPLGLREQLIAKQTTAYSRCVAPPGVAESEFNLLPSRYLTVHDGEDLEAKVLSSRTVRLGDIATLIRPSHVRDADDGTSEFQEVQLQDLPQGGHIREARPIAVRTDVQRRALTQVLQPNDSLASSKGTIGRIGIVPVALLPGTRWLASQAFVIIRLNSDAPISARYLYMFLRSDIGQALLRKRAGGGTVPRIQAADLQSLPVLLPSDKQLKTIEADFDSLRDASDLLERVQSKIAGFSSASRFFAE